ncbi:MAG: toll/interleukin-1 receptor domain-containing protein [Chloroflexi bacterium]|nr:toll/interleukin-1 receptor domain-containing protein [Chloroflexota bacterium]
MQYVYISYPDDDYAFAHRLVEDLQAVGYAVFVDAVSDVGTVSWAAETRHAIRACGVVLMILSPADGRRTGIRHEGILANRLQKPLIVLLRSAGELPRYLQNAAAADFSGDYPPAFEQLRSLLPSALTLLTASDPLPRRRPRRPPHLPNRRRRRLVWVVWWLLLVSVCIVGGIAFGVIPV